MATRTKKNEQLPAPIPGPVGEDFVPLSPCRFIYKADQCHTYPLQGVLLIRAAEVKSDTVRRVAAVDSLLTKQQCAAAIGASTATLDRLVRAGRVPFVLVGDRRRFDLAAVRAALGKGADPTIAPPRDEVIPGVQLRSRRRNEAPE